MKWFYSFVSFTIHGRNFYIGSKEKYAYTKFGFTDLFLMMFGPKPIPKAVTG